MSEIIVPAWASKPPKDYGHEHAPYRNTPDLENPDPATMRRVLEHLRGYMLTDDYTREVINAALKGIECEFKT